MIEPTAGRIVWYHPEARDEAIVRHNEDPCAAIVAFVHSPRIVNLSVIDHNGRQHARPSITLVQDGDAHPNENFAEWMPYQKGQAAKTEALLAKPGVGAGQTVPADQQSAAAPQPAATDTAAATASA